MESLLLEHEVEHLIRKTNTDKLQFGSYAANMRWAELIDFPPYYINVSSSNDARLYITVRYLSEPGTADIKKSSSYLTEPDESTHQEHSWKFEF